MDGPPILVQENPEPYLLLEDGRKSTPSWKESHKMN